MKLNKLFKKAFVVANVLAAGVVLAACSSNSKSSSKDSYKSELNQKGTLTIGLEGTYSPYSYRKDGKLTGFEVELGNKLAKEMGLKAKFVPTKWDGLVAGLGSNKYDVVLNNITATPARAKSYIFSKPYIYSRYALITRQGDDSIKTLKDVKGKKLAEGTGTNNELVAKQNGATIVPSGDFVTSLSLIRQKRVDATVNAREAWYSYKKTNSTEGLVYHDVSSEKEPAKIVGLFNKKSTKLRSETNKALKTLRADGTLKKLSQKYFGADITE